MLLHMPNTCIIFENLAETTVSPLPFVFSVIGTIVLFILVRLAMYLYRYGDRNLLIFARRIADLDACMLRLDLVIENLERGEKQLSNLRIVSYQGHASETLAELKVAPIQRQGSSAFIQKDGSGYSLHAANGTKNEAVVEFVLTAPCKQAYLVAENQKGKTVKAYLNLSTSETQMLSFRKA